MTPLRVSVRKKEAAPSLHSRWLMVCETTWAWLFFDGSLDGPPGRRRV